MVVVDDLQDWGWVVGGRVTNTCQMVASTPEELAAMASHLGLDAVRYDPESPHGPERWALLSGERSLAIAAGARVFPGTLGRKWEAFFRRQDLALAEAKPSADPKKQ